MDLSLIEQFGSLDLIASQVVEGFITGLHKSPFHGFSVEFAEHRLYNNGESVKNVDWKLYGKTEKLFVKKYEEETNLRCHILIDTSSSMYYPISKDNKSKVLNKISFSVYASAALAYLLTKQRDAVGITTFSNKIEKITEVKSNASHLKYLYGILENTLPNNNNAESKKTNITATLHILAEQIHKRSLIIIFSDMFDDFSEREKLFTALQHLKHQKNEVILFHVSDHDSELNFNFNAHPYKFIDMEDGKEIKLNPAEVRKHYIESMSEYIKDLTYRCNMYHIDFVEADIKRGFYQVLNSYLIKRAKMF